MKPLNYQINAVRGILYVSINLRLPDVNNLPCAGCNACYIGETSRHRSTRLRGEHLSTDRNAHIFQRLQQSETRHKLCS